jgi:2'-hydroxyisoflavone reductase
MWTTPSTAGSFGASFGNPLMKWAPTRIATPSHTSHAMTTRRQFLKTGLAVGGAALAGCGRPAAEAMNAAMQTPQRTPLNLLILGGTGFIGPHLVRHAVARGHRVTIFTRGRRNADLPASVERLIGDRNGQLSALEGRKWDAVIDDSATNPEWVRMSTELLKDSGQYLFTSSTGVYYPYLTRGVDESVAPRLEVVDPKDGSETYGVAKAQSERQVQRVFGDRATIVRPTYIVGPGDTTDRFPYWPVRLARGGEVLAPGKRTDPVQFIDVRDLAAFMVKLVEDRRSGIFNVAGPKSPMTIQQFLEGARDALNADVRFTWVDDYAFLEQHKIVGVVPWVLQTGNELGHLSARNDRAIAAGLTFTPLATTVRDTLAWWATVPEARRTSPRFALTPEQETAALAAWKARGGPARE